MADHQATTEQLHTGVTLATGQAHKIKAAPRDLRVRLPISPTEASRLDDKFTLLGGGDEPESAKWQQSKTLNKDGLQGQGFVDLVFQVPAPGLRYWLQVDQGDARLRYHAFEKLTWSQVDPALEDRKSNPGPTVGGSSGSRDKLRYWRLDKVDTSGKLILLKNEPIDLYLTFDDGPFDVSGEILDILAKGGVRATFFIKGAQLARKPDLQFQLVKRMLAEGHALGNHTYSHTVFQKAQYMALLQQGKQDQVRQDFVHNLDHLQALFKNHGDVFPGFHIARLPGDGRTIPQYVQMVTKQLKLPNAQWDFEFAATETPLGHLKANPWKYADGVKAEVQRLPHSREIVLAHDPHWAGKMDRLSKLVAKLETIARFLPMVPVPAGLHVDYP